MNVAPKIKVLLLGTLTVFSALLYADENVLELSKADVLKVEKSTVMRFVTLNGSLQPLRTVNVNAQVDGEIDEVLVREGEPVKKGQVLARFSTLELSAHLNERVASLDGANAQKILAEKNFAKVQNMFKKKYISQSDFDTAQNQFTMAISTVKAAESGVELARKSLADAEVTSPLEGIISERFAEPGQRTAMHVKLFVVVNLTELEFSAAVPSSEIPLVRVGQEATFVVDGFLNRMFNATLTRINPMALSGSHAYFVYLSVANKDQVLRGGMLAKGELVIEEKKDVFAVPATLLREGVNAGKALYIINENTIIETPVETGLMDTKSGMVEIISGISTGAVVLNNRSKVDSGRSVRLLDN